MATLTPYRRFDGYALDSTNGIIIEDWDETVLAKASYGSRLDGEIGLYGRSETDGRRIVFKGSISGADDGAVRDYFDALMAKLMVRGERYLQLRDDRRIAVRLEKSIKRSFVKGTQQTSCRFAVSFRSRFPTWESTSSASSYVDISSSPTTLTLPAITGTAPTWPTVTIQNNGLQFDGRTLVMTAGSKQLALSGLSMSSGQAIAIDFREGLIDMAGAQSPRPVSIEGGFFPMEASATPTWEFVTDVASPTIRVTVTYRPQYWEA